MQQHYLCIVRQFLNFGHFMTDSHLKTKLWEQKNEKHEKKKSGEIILLMLPSG